VILEAQFCTPGPHGLERPAAKWKSKRESSRRRRSVIAFDLECPKGHRFEGWFNNLQSFEEQNAGKLVSCPVCGDTRVKRVLSPVAVKGSDSPSIDYHRLAKEVVDYIHRSFEDVGTHFTREALKMHYGVTEKRNIRGSATHDEEKVLREEKIEFFKIPGTGLEGKKKN
jgi:hypothetical protein